MVYRVPFLEFLSGLLYGWLSKLVFLLWLRNKRVSYEISQKFIQGLGVGFLFNRFKCSRFWGLGSVGFRGFRVMV